MTETIKEFLNREDIKEIKSHTLGENMEQDFFRDPLRTIFYNPNLFYAPADGVVLYAKEMEADEPYEIKGAKFTLKEMLDDEDYKDRSLVVGIFMTALNVHVNRVPSSCYYLNAKETNPLQTHGVSMIVAENNLLEDFKIKKQDMGYLVYNEKRISKFYCPDIKGCFYLVQIADRDVDCCLTWRKGQYLTQGDRFGQVRFGSQTEMVIPLKKGIKFETLVKSLDAVEAGVDPVLKIKGEIK